MKYVGLSVLSCGTGKKSLDAVSKYLGVWTLITPWLLRIVLMILVARLPVALIRLIICVNNDEFILLIY